MGPVKIIYTTRTMNEAAKLQKLFATLLETIGFQFKEFNAIPNGSKVEVTLIFTKQTKKSKK